MTTALLTLFALAQLIEAPALVMNRTPFDVETTSEVVAHIEAGCDACAWEIEGREAVLLELTLDGVYSQHVVLVRGTAPAEYTVMLGSLPPGPHELRIAQDQTRSARNAGRAHVQSVHIESFGVDAPEYGWLSHAPVLRERPGTIEHFSDVPLVMYAERNAGNEGPAPYAFQYTTIFSNEDGGTPADRLMATWGRTTDIEFVFGVTAPVSDRPARAIIQVEGHRWVDFTGHRFLGHPELWVATDNNMVADHGTEALIRFAPAPTLLSLDRRSREHAMDLAAWTYVVTAQEMVREGRIGSAVDGHGRMADPRRYTVVEACAEVTNADLRVAVGVRAPGGEVAWYASDDPNAAFVIARSGCFRAGVILPDGTPVSAIEAVRVRATSRRGSGGQPSRVTLTRLNQLLELDADFRPVITRVGWSGAQAVSVDTNGFALWIDRRR